MVFDIDGTLVDSKAMILAAQERTFALHGIPMPDERRALSIVGLSLPLAFRVLAGEDAPIEALCEDYKRVFRDLRLAGDHDEPLFPGAADIIAALAARDDVRLGIATGKTRPGVTHLVEKHGWDGVFVTTQTADDAPSKPHPGMLLRAMAETGARPEDTFMIGDTTFDMEMAVKAGCRPVGVAWGNHDAADLTAAGAERVLAAMEHLAEHIDALAERGPLA